MMETGKAARSMALENSLGEQVKDGFPFESKLAQDFNGIEAVYETDLLNTFMLNHFCTQQQYSLYK